MNKRVRKVAIVVVLMIVIFICVVFNEFRRIQGDDDDTNLNGTWKVAALQCETRVPMGDSPLGMSFVCKEGLSSVEWRGKRFKQCSKHLISGEELSRRYNLIVSGFDSAIMIEYQEVETSKEASFNLITFDNTLYLLMGGEEYTRGIYLLERQRDGFFCLDKIRERR